MRTVLAIWIGLGASSLAQVASTVSLSNGVQLEISAQPAPDAASGLRTEIQPATGNSFYRIYWDENNLAVFAYELQVERTPDGEQFRVTARPVGDAFAARFPNADTGKPTPTLPDASESPLLKSGERFTVDIPTNP